MPTALVVAGVLLVAGNLRAAITTVGPVLTDIEDDLGLPSSAASILVSLPLLAFAAVSPFVPRLADRMGLERAIGASLGVLALGLVLRSVPPQAMLWIGTALIGVAIAVLNVVLPALVKRDFPTRIGQITGAYSAVQSTFAAIAAGVAVPVAGATALGWRLPLGMWAGLALVALGVMAPQLRRTTAVAEPVDVSVQPTPAPVAARSPWRTLLGWQVTLFMGLQSTVFYVVITWLPTIETDAGVSDGAAGAHQFMLNACGIVGALGCSALIARLADQRYLGAAIGTVLLIGVVGVLVAPSASIVWACVFGVGGGSAIVLSLSLFGLRTANHRQAASLSGMAQCFGYVLAAVGPVLAGALHDATDSWTPVLVILLVGTCVIIAAGYLAGRDRVAA
nr:MFS transporter [Gordonia humi]